MFIEGIRHAKNKWRVWIGILLGLIVISLLFAFGNVGGNIGASSGTGSGDAVAAAETTAKDAASAAKDDKKNMEAQGTAASAYLSLAAYESLYMEDNQKSYEEALTYAKAMVDACGSADKPDYATAYGYEISAYQGLGDAESLSAAFNESLKTVTLDQTYLNSYYTAMSALDANDQFISDMKAATAVLQELAVEEPAAEEETEDGEEAAATAETEATPSELIDYVTSLVTQASAAE